MASLILQFSIFFGIFYIAVAIFFVNFYKLSNSVSFRSTFVVSETSENKGGLNLKEAFGSIKVEAFGIFLTMFLCFLSWPAVFFASSVRWNFASLTPSLSAS